MNISFPDIKAKPLVLAGAAAVRRFRRWRRPRGWSRRFSRAPQDVVREAEAALAAG